MLEFMRNKLVSVSLKDASTLVVHAVLDDTIYSLELELEVQYPELTCLSIAGRWKRWTTPVCPRSLDFLGQAKGFCLGPGIDDQIHKTIGRTSCRHFANLLIECSYAVQETSRFLQWQAAVQKNPDLDLATFMRATGTVGSGTVSGKGPAEGGDSPRISESSHETVEAPEPVTTRKPVESVTLTEPEIATAGKGFILDLHMHTFPASKCASSSVDDMILEAKQLGLAGVCITDHNAPWPQDRVKALMDRYGMPIFRGNEIITDQGDMLVFGFYEDIQGIIKLSRLKAMVDAAGGFIIAAHPFRGFLTFGAGQLGLTPEAAMERDMFHHVHAIEILNGKVTDSENRLAAQVALGLGLPATGGSDAHDVTTLGVYATRFNTALADEQDLVAALCSGQYQPVAFRR